MRHGFTLIDLDQPIGYQPCRGLISSRAEKGSKSYGFTLIELSITIVIAGLLLGGVLVGTNMVRSAQLKSMLQDIQTYQSAVNIFDTKYNAIPGDMENATLYWGKLNSECSSASGVVDSDGVCNGDGDGVLMSDHDMYNGGLASNDATEIHMFWKHLSKAGLISGNYSGLSGTTGHYWSSEAGVNVPKGPGPGSAYFAFTASSKNSTFASFLAPWVLSTDYENSIAYGGVGPWGMGNPDLSAAEALSIDSKVDDGKPGRGKVIATGWGGYCSDAASTNDLDADYLTTDGEQECNLAFRHLF